MILYTLYKNSYIDIQNLDSTKGITVYVNSTNRCTCSCTFCLRQTKEMIEGNDLWLKKEPTVAEIIAEFEKYDLNDFKEVVFCGFGEPLIRHDDLMEVARYIKEYLRLTRSRYGMDSFAEMLDFASKCKPYVAHVVLTVVDIIGTEEIAKCQKIADDLGVTLRVRPYEE